MRITRIYADESGEPRFADAEIQMVSAPCFLTFRPFVCARSARMGDIRLFSTPPELRMHDFHTAPTRLFAVALSGTVEYETSDGEVRRQAPGSVVLVEDKRGGHITRFSEEQHFSFLSPSLTTCWQPKSPVVPIGWDQTKSGCGQMTGLAAKRGAVSALRPPAS